MPPSGCRWYHSRLQSLLQQPTHHASSASTTSSVVVVLRTHHPSSASSPASSPGTPETNAAHAQSCTRNDRFDHSVERHERADAQIPLLVRLRGLVVAVRVRALTLTDLTALTWLQLRSPTWIHRIVHGIVGVALRLLHVYARHGQTTIVSVWICARRAAAATHAKPEPEAAHARVRKGLISTSHVAQVVKRRISPPLRLVCVEQLLALLLL